MLYNEIVTSCPSANSFHSVWTDPSHVYEILWGLLGNISNSLWFPLHLQAHLCQWPARWFYWEVMWQQCEWTWYMEQLTSREDSMAPDWSHLGRNEDRITSKNESNVEHRGRKPVSSLRGPVLLPDRGHNCLTLNWDIINMMSSYVKGDMISLCYHRTCDSWNGVGIYSIGHSPPYSSAADSLDFEH